MLKVNSAKLIPCIDCKKNVQMMSVFPRAWIEHGDLQSNTA